ncbi:unnamed protein product, partial [marine sediment metagenome]
TIYAEIFGVDETQIIKAAEALQTEMNEDEREQLTMLIYGPKDETTARAWIRVQRENLAEQTHNPATIETQGETDIETQGETDKEFVAFARFSQEPDEDSLGENARSALDWENTGEKFMSPKQRMLAGEMYRRTKGKQLDEKHFTMSPGSRSEHGSVPCLRFTPASNEIRLGNVRPEFRGQYYGVRRIVSKEL